MMGRFSDLPLMERVKMLRGPFLENPQVYTPLPAAADAHSGSHGSMKRSFSIMQYFGRPLGVLIFTYDDSDEFRPTFKHHFDLTNATFLNWSPLASYMLCIKEKELTVMLFEPCCKEVNLKIPIDNDQIAMAGFSPQHKFIFLLFYQLDPKKKIDNTAKPLKLEILGASTGKLLKTFHYKSIFRFAADFEDIFKWDSNDSYLAFLAGGVLRIYETESFCVVRRYEKIQYYSCSPSEPILALFDDCSVKFVEARSGSTVFQSKDLNGVDYHKPVWQSAGDYLACICRGTDCNKIFVVSLKSGMSKFITLPASDYIDLAWKGPNGKGFAVYYGTNGGQRDSEVNFYSIQDDGQTLSHKLLKAEKGMKARFLHWSPNGSHIVVQGPLDGPGELYFYDADNHQQLAFEKFRVCLLQWDSSSRFCFTQASRRNGGVVRIWSPRGEKLIDVGPCSLLFMRWCHKQSCATEDLMLIDDDDDDDAHGHGGDLGKDSSGNRDGDVNSSSRKLTCLQLGDDMDDRES